MMLLGAALMWWSLSDVARKAREAESDVRGDEGGEVCVQVVTAAKDSVTGDMRDFPTPCDVPEGWEIVPPGNAE